MMKKLPTINHTVWIAFICLIGAVLAYLILSHGPHAPTTDAHGHDHGNTADSKAKRGPNGGELMHEGDFTLESKIKEGSGQALLAVWLSKKGKPLPAGAAQLSMQLTRPTGDVTEFTFTEQHGMWLSQQTIAEPHIFVATLSVKTATEPYLFTLTVEEDKINLSEAQLQAAAVGTEAAASAILQKQVQLQGEIKLNEDQMAHVVPRHVGVVERVLVSAGQSVKQGQVLAVIASHTASDVRSELQTLQSRLALAKQTHEREKKLWEMKVSAEQDYRQAEQALREVEIALHGVGNKASAMGLAGGRQLNQFELRAPISGLIIDKHLNLGEAVKEDANSFTIADVSSVWVELQVPASALPFINRGQQISVTSSALAASNQGQVLMLGAVLGEQNRVAKARLLLPNRDGRWRPGMVVSAELLTEQLAVPVSVPNSALHQVNNVDTVYVRINGGFMPQPVRLGERDAKRTAILQGLKVGQLVATSNSFVVKAEAGKASAEHAH